MKKGPVSGPSYRRATIAVVLDRIIDYAVVAKVAAIGRVVPHAAQGSRWQVSFVERSSQPALLYETKGQLLSHLSEDIR